MRRAFTVIELLIAIALGLVLCLTATAAMRAALSAVTAADRLSLENAVLREGVSAALEDLDFWTSLDDPDAASPAARPLRATGQPFAPLDAPVDCDFDVSAPKNWWRGLGCSLIRRDYGDYAIVSRIDHPDPVRARLALFHRAVVDGLGFFAMADHAPADAIHAYYGADHRVPDEFIVKSPEHFGGYDAGVMPGDFIMLLDDHAFALTRQPWYLANDVAHRRFSVWSAAGLGWSGVGNWQQSGLFQCVDPVRSLTLAPADWPRLEVAARRTASAYRQWQIATVSVASPLTGQRQRLTFSAMGTTLRGARKQRDRVSGWAVAGHPTLDIAE